MDRLYHSSLRRQLSQENIYATQIFTSPAAENSDRENAEQPLLRIVPISIHQLMKQLVAESGKLASHTLQNYIKETESRLTIALLQDTEC